MVGLGVLPPPALGNIPELALQFFRSSEQAAPEELLRRGLGFPFYALSYRSFFFDFLNVSSPPFCIFRCFVVNCPKR